MDKKIFDKLIKDIDRSDLEKLTYKMIQLSGQTEQTFLDYCQENISSEHKNLVIERQIKMHWSNAYEIISDDNRYGGCSDSDEEDAIYEVEALTELVEENMVSWVCRKEILDEMLQQIAYDNSGFVDFLVDTAIKFCRTKDEKIYLVDSLSRIGSSYYKGVAASMYKELGLDDKYVEARKANLRYGSDYIELSYYYKKRNQNDLALKVALDGLIIVMVDWMKFIIIYFRLMNVRIMKLLYGSCIRPR